MMRANRQAPAIRWMTHFPGVPTSGAFAPSSITGDAGLLLTGSGTTITLNNGGYFELNDGTRYTCTSPNGCTIVNGTVTQGTVAGRAASGTEPPTDGGMESVLLELSGCTDGRYVDDPDGNPGLVGDCHALVGFVNAAAQERELPDDHVLRQWGSGEQMRIDRWGGVRVSGGRVTFLGLNEKGITDISALAGLTNLTELYLQFNAITDISALAGLTNLTTLYLQSTEITDISALAGLTNLTALHLSFNEITDISALAGLTNLWALNLQFNAITDISALAGLTNLTTLYLQSTEITDISALAGLTNLTRLDLQSNAITDISALAGLTNLTRLDLQSNAITDISALAGLTNLTTLYLQFNAITDISALAGLTNLTTLYLQFNEITDISLLALNEGWGDRRRDRCQRQSPERRLVRHPHPGPEGPGRDGQPRSAPRR